MVTRMSNSDDVRGLRQAERRIKAKHLQYNGIQPSSSGEINLRFSSPCTFM
ncbi:unnamed protein product [Protopolystoma xenopodis]|uniref:Uncharacterized protein n=1 Tax=Protopolystoma xenopodis TaxID=117903 RepID=A0A3S5AJZ2_9PLAT|nr:unnamed protein product [Protopolystoma xenopodis]